jgi:hypothetical protein
MLNTRYDIPLRVLVMNFQSIKNKTVNLENMIQTVQPDIIIGNESWLHDNAPYTPQRFYQQIIISIGKTANQMHTEEFLHILVNNK